MENCCFRRIEGHDFACTTGDDATGKPGLAQDFRPVAHICCRLPGQGAGLRLIHEEHVDIGERAFQLHCLGGRNCDGRKRLFAGAGNETERRQRIFGQIGVAEEKIAGGNRFADRANFEAARGKQPVKIHIGKRYDEIAVAFHNGGVARRATVEEGEGRIFHARLSCGFRHGFTGDVAAARGDDADLKTEPGEIARCVETAAAGLFHPGAGIAGAGRRFRLDHAAPVYVRAAQNEYFLHACVSLSGGWKDRTIRPKMVCS